MRFSISGSEHRHPVWYDPACIITSAFYGCIALLMLVYGVASRSHAITTFLLIVLMSGIASTAFRARRCLYQRRCGYGNPLLSYMPYTKMRRLQQLLILDVLFALLIFGAALMVFQKRTVCIGLAFGCVAHILHVTKRYNAGAGLHILMHIFGCVLLLQLCDSCVNQTSGEQRTGD